MLELARQQVVDACRALRDRGLVVGTAGNVSVPVSYTHLDVYKRQVYVDRAGAYAGARDEALLRHTSSAN